MSPHYGTLRDGNQTTIPASCLAATYATPPFRIQTVASPAAASAATPPGADSTRGVTE